MGLKADVHVLVCCVGPEGPHPTFKEEPGELL